MHNGSQICFDFYYELQGPPGPTGAGEPGPPGTPGAAVSLLCKLLVLFIVIVNFKTEAFFYRSELLKKTNTISLIT